MICNESLNEKCPHCNQSLNYVIKLDNGTADILKAMATAIRRKRTNEIHPRNEMEVAKKSLDYETMIREGCLTSNQVGNLSKARFHGLIARIKSKPGYYCLTSKGAKFLKGEAIPRCAVISKTAKKQIGYLADQIITIAELNHAGEYWSGIDFNIGDDNQYHQNEITQSSLFVLPVKTKTKI